ncbi:MAG: SIS domain-containing protein [Thaumarchaeota archaeon]|nr:SIS domain-containing protein [Nitrososphaerota archaeon]
MNTIDAYANDLSLQLDYLKKFKPQKTVKNAFFVGSGDSLCAAMLAEAFSNYGMKSCDPLELAKNKTIADKKHAYFVSISGNTISNVKAAKSVLRKTAITKNHTSKLAKLCKNTILLDYSDSGILTSGSIGFLASALTCISLVYKFKIKNAKKIFLEASTQSKKINLCNQIYFLGSQYTYPIAMYASAKLGEILGVDSHYERIEQFSHMGLFSAKPGDTVIILEQKNKHNSKLASHLPKLGLHVYHPSINGDAIAQVLFYTFVSQMNPLKLARKKKIRDCYFVSQKKIRAASSGMIY